MRSGDPLFWALTLHRTDQHGRQGFLSMVTVGPSMMCSADRAARYPSTLPPILLLLMLAAGCAAPPPTAAGADRSRGDTAAATTGNVAEPTSSADPDNAAHASDGAYTFTVIDAPNGTFGYDILHNGSLLVHQPGLPGQPGVEGCRSREQAERLASFVVSKITRGIMPPTVTTDELDSLGIVHLSNTKPE